MSRNRLRFNLNEIELNINVSIVNEAVFIEKKAGSLVVHNKSLKLPARTTLEGIAASLPIEDYDINEHIKALSGKQAEATEFEL